MFKWIKNILYSIGRKFYIEIDGSYSSIYLWKNVGWDNTIKRRWDVDSKLPTRSNFMESVAPIPGMTVREAEDLYEELCAAKEDYNKQIEEFSRAAKRDEG